MDQDETQKIPVTLITGASMGIGKELAKVFAANGHHLLLVARSQEKLELLANELHEKHGVTVKVIAKDLIKPRSVDEVYAEVSLQSLSIDILVNNAGYAGYGEFVTTDLTNELEMIQLNVSALTHLTKVFLRDMKKAGKGRILNVASTAAFQPGPTMAVYYATKAYVLHFTEAIREELRGTGIAVTALCPGATKTNFEVRAQVQETRLFKFGSGTADVVAQKAYQGLMANQAIVIPGLMNKLMAFSVRFAPRALVRWVVKQISKRVKH